MSDAQKNDDSANNNSANILIEAATPSSVELLERFMPASSMPDVHRKRFAQQEQGKGPYLIALHEGVPIGLVLLHFNNPVEAAARTYPDCAYVEGLDVQATWRRRGVATRLLGRLEALSRQRRHPAIGLYVGVGNDGAQALYRKLGYAPSDLPPYRVTWPVQDEAGNITEEGELCTFWLKSLLE